MAAVDPLRRPTVAARPSRPLPIGTIVGKVPAEKSGTGPRLTPEEAAVYKQLGVPSGETPDLSSSPAAQRLTREIANIRQHATNLGADEELPIPVNPLKMPPERQLTELSEKEQAEIQELMNQYAVEKERTERAAKISPAVLSVPGMQEALTVAEQADEDSVIGIEIVDDRGFNPLRSVAKAQSMKQEAAPVAQPEAVAGGTPPPMSNCPHCGLNLEAPVGEIEAFDKAAFLQEVVLGGKRFRKEYKLFGDRVRIVFRSLLPSEAAAARAQVHREVEDKKNMTYMGMLESIASYRLLMSLELIERQGSPPMEFEEFSKLANADTPNLLLELHTYFGTHVYNNENMERVIGQKYAKFNRTCERLEVMADGENF